MRNKARLISGHKSPDSGFALPVAVGMGLIMLLLGITVVLRSQNDQVLAINEAANTKTNTAAELGITKVREFLNRYRILATYDSSGWRGNSDPDLNESCSAGTFSSDLNKVFPSGSDGWTDVDPGDPSKGKFRVLSYTYADNPGGAANDPVGTGTLVVQGQLNNGDAVSQAEVAIPLYDIASTASNKSMPGLWVNTSILNSITDTDVMGPCSGTLNVNTGSREILRTNLVMPSIPSQPSSVNTLTNIAGLTLPRKNSSGVITDTSDGGVYKYSVPNISGSFEVTEGKIVEIWVDGNIALSSMPVQHYCGSDPNCGPFDVSIYGQAASGNIIMDKGTSICDVFFHAPNYTVTINSTSTVTPKDCVDYDSDGDGSQPTEHNTGVFWVKTWDDKTGSATPMLNSPRASWPDAPGTQPPPQMAPVSSFEWKQAD
jgi:hypothetical protein